MPLIRFNEHYLVQDGVRFLMTEDGEPPVACRVSHGALHDLATSALVAAMATYSKLTGT
jgi:hypothetical protein